ncbi:MAG: ATP phosphoribosyltransferase regulatory subunit [Lachnospiraceae bacterium]|nr:ATP phosphoribosyltransferase regulatory subunit [Lachnospiraceae bacterium]MBO7362763.1 ATP phosphoribosyltransferase regulatory subunit [Lachnospiraceae bacterium]MBO7530259.1 ATP phosphoribosyltransferase regulatory subunit [Lachnospiraceae bacterium]MBP5252939.1 ATP phosphoribosyltransferase regulatory subunit [Lachnospiraceae bacterium]MBP5555689.1 ATP phosphoribosyltransferase regulatory subunit [Lachnospiraceae bacterium]
MSNFKNNLLHTPDGVRDIYGKEYDNIKYVRKTISDCLSSYGYSDIQTPSFEYFDVFSKEVGTIPSRELYKFFDKDNETIALRPDFTPSIARCAAKYFMDEDRPLRFSYIGSTFQNISSLQGKYSEVTQEGAEFIGDASVEADAEMVSLLIESLLKTGLENFRISVGEVDYFKGLCSEAKLSPEEEADLRDLISSKNPIAAADLLKELNISDEMRDKLLRITDTFADHSMLSELEKDAGNDISKKAIERLTSLFDLLKIRGYEKYVSFDLGMLSKYQYYTGIVFKAFALGTGSPIAMGGRYDKLLSYFGKDAPAVGFVILPDDVEKLLERQGKAFPEESTVEEIVYDPCDPSSYEEAVKKACLIREKGGRAALIKK